MNNLDPCLLCRNKSQCEEDLPTFLRRIADELVARDTLGGTFAEGVAMSLRGRAYVLGLVQQGEADA